MQTDQLNRVGTSNYNVVAEEKETSYLLPLHVVVSDLQLRFGSIRKRLLPILSIEQTKEDVKVAMAGGDAHAKVFSDTPLFNDAERLHTELFDLNDSFKWLIHRLRIGLKQEHGDAPVGGNPDDKQNSPSYFFPLWEQAIILRNQVEVFPQELLEPIVIGGALKATKDATESEFKNPFPSSTFFSELSDILWHLYKTENILKDMDNRIMFEKGKETKNG